MTTNEIEVLFEQIKEVKIGVIGDFAVDLYYSLQTQTGEQSLETKKDVFWGSQPKASLGAAGNVVQNLAALGIHTVHAVGCVGDDLYGREMQHLFQTLNVNSQHLLKASENWDTCVYTKPNETGEEANRIDFGTANSLSDTFFDTLLTGLESLVTSLDVLIINQQFAKPLLTQERVSAINGLIQRFPNVQFVADMRDVGTYVRGATLKVNTNELARFLNVAAPEHPELNWCVENGNTLRENLGGALLITRGPAGILYLDQHGAQYVDGLHLSGELDTVGAGDTVVAAWSACRGAGATVNQALEMANLAAAVTVQKLQQTGTATLPEILTIHKQFFTND
ncbi:carbohydrate kinase [Spirosoma sp. BT702]|uniref:Carbohydrate kinase n=1 Tax=Spirosoma profusum TaxID=2771354 RepID=A0A926Y3V8_9BACT|nr:PfkB family carbohydrate kinase [Spirosoma profusum]MBD2703758.1 carbohydrate kinase [Spirosoma profusum]